MNGISVWITAYREYLIRKNIPVNNLSNDELSRKFNEIVKENNLEEDAKKFVNNYCMMFK